MTPHGCDGVRKIVDVDRSIEIAKQSLRPQHKQAKSYDLQGTLGRALRDSNSRPSVP
jgi:hypothetical protein